MAVVPKGNRMQNTEGTAHAIASVNDNGNVKDDSQPLNLKRSDPL